MRTSNLRIEGMLHRRERKCQKEIWHRSPRFFGGAPRRPHFRAAGKTEELQGFAMPEGPARPHPPGRHLGPSVEIRSSFV